MAYYLIQSIHTGWIKRILHHNVSPLIDGTINVIKKVDFRPTDVLDIKLKLTFYIIMIR